MSASRVIPARRVDFDTMESFPYFPAEFGPGLPPEEGGDDDPVAAGISSPEEDARRLASVDQIIFEKHQQAEREAQEIARRAFDEGFKAGEAEGRTFGESQYLSQVQRLDGALRELSDSLALCRRASQDEVLALALAMAEHLAGREIEQGIQTIRPLLESILASHPFPESPEDPQAIPGILVLVNPRDLEELGDAATAHPGVTLRPLESLSRGSLRLESANGVLDATLERRRDRLLGLLRAAREKEGL
jgi:flagellar assembly protein FliH